MTNQFKSATANWWIFCSLLLLLPGTSWTQENTNQNKYRQQGQELPTPKDYRNAAGAPGNAYWQQQADYKIDIVLDDKTQIISGEETITYHNNSPDPLGYLWLQLDQNRRAKESDTYKINTQEIKEDIRCWTLKG